MVARRWEQQPSKGVFEAGDQLMITDSAAPVGPEKQKLILKSVLDTAILATVEKTNNATGFQVAGGTSISKLLTVSENSTINQNLSTTSPVVFGGLTSNAETVNGWISANIGGTSPGPRIVAGRLNGFASIGGHTNDLSMWEPLVINPESGLSGIGIGLGTNASLGETVNATVHGRGSTILGIAASAIADASIYNNQVNIWYDESPNNIVFKAKNSLGAVTNFSFKWDVTSSTLSPKTSFGIDTLLVQNVAQTKDFVLTRTDDEAIFNVSGAEDLKLAENGGRVGVGYGASVALPPYPFSIFSSVSTSILLESDAEAPVLTWMGKTARYNTVGGTNSNSIIDWGFFQNSPGNEADDRIYAGQSGLSSSFFCIFPRSGGKATINTPFNQPEWWHVNGNSRTVDEHYFGDYTMYDGVTAASVPTPVNGFNFFSNSDDSYKPYVKDTGGVLYDLLAGAPGLNYASATTTTYNMTASDDVIVIDTVTNNVNVVIDETFLANKSVLIIFAAGGNTASFQAKAGQFINGSASAYTMATNFTCSTISSISPGSGGMVISSFSVG